MRKSFLSTKVAKFIRARKELFHTPVKCKGMMEKKDIGKCLSELPAGNADEILGISGVNGVLTTSSKITETGGCGSSALGVLSTGKWYRIAIGALSNHVSTALINIGKYYSTNAPTAQLFYIFADGYSGSQLVTCLAGSGKSIGKARILYKASISEKVILDIYISAIGSNSYYMSYSNNIGFDFSQKIMEVSDTPDAGYFVKEFAF